MLNTYTSAYAGLLLTSLAFAGAMTLDGCYSSSDPLEDQGIFKYQSTGYCNDQCSDSAVFGLSGGSNCWCGDKLPAKGDKVGDEKCSTNCDGYPQDTCGGSGFYQVYLTGKEGKVDHVEGGGGGNNGGNNNDDDSANNNNNNNKDGKPDPSSSSSSSSSDSDSSISSDASTTDSSPSVITTQRPGETVVITMPASPASQVDTTPEAQREGDKEKDDDGPNVGGIAAGVVVGVVVVAAAIGVFFFMRHRKRKAAQEDYQRSNQVSDFMRGAAERKPPASGYSNMSDSRLDPEAGPRRNSQGSIADDQDYSRRILRVANPDRG